MKHPPADPQNTARRRVLSALEAGEREHPAVRAWLASREPAALLARALDAARQERWEDYSAALALARDATPPSAALALAAVLVAGGELVAGLDAGREGRSRAGLGLRLRWSVGAGWYREAERCAEELFAAEPERPEPALELASLLSSRRNARGAYAWLERAAAAGPLPPRLLSEQALVASAAGLDDAARAHALEALSSPKLEPAAGLRAVHALWRAGDLAGARAHLASLRAAHPSSRELHALEARFALEAGDTAEARRAARACLALGEDALAHTVLGALELFPQVGPSAREHLERALSLAPREHLTLCWQAERLAREGAHDAALEVLSRALASTGELVPTTWLQYFRSYLRSEAPTSVPARHFDEGRAVLEPLVASLPPSDGEALSLERALALLDDALGQLTYSRGAVPIALSPGGAARRLSVAPGPRAAARLALEQIDTTEPARVLSALDDAVARYPSSSLPRCHRGELRLWLGDLAGARADLEACLAHTLQTRWAYIGLTLLHSLEGRHEEALETCARGVEVMGSTGPAVYAYRGEALRRAGRPREALEDLSRAVEQHPERLGTWVNLALAARAVGDAERAASALREVKQRGAVPLAVAAAHRGAPPWQALSFDDARAEQTLETLLEMLRGNRSSSCTTWFHPDGRGPFVLNRTRAPARGGETAQAFRALHALLQGAPLG